MLTVFCQATLRTSRVFLERFGSASCTYSRCNSLLLPLSAWILPWEPAPRILDDRASCRGVQKAKRWMTVNVHAEVSRQLGFDRLVAFPALILNRLFSLR